MSEINFFEANRALFDELGTVTDAAIAAIKAGDMQAWADNAARGSEIHSELARRRRDAVWGPYLNRAATEETPETRS